MLPLVRRIIREPLWIIGALWPFVLLTPHLPGLPRPSINGLPWRQELVVSVLLSMTLGLLTWRTWMKRQAGRRTEHLKFLPLYTAAPFVLWVWFSASWATHPHAAVQMAFQWSAYIVFFALTSQAVARPKVFRSSLISLGTVICILCIACAIESWVGAPLTDGNSRSDLKPLFRGSGGFGEIMSVAACVFAALALYFKRPRYALMCGATATLAWLAVLQSLERAPFIGACAGMLLLLTGALIVPVCRPRRWVRLSLIVGAFASVTILQTVPLSFLQTASLSPTNKDTSTVARLREGFSSDANSHVRLLFWGVGLEMLRNHPLLGVGANNYEVAYAEARAQFSARHPDSPLVGLNDHLLAVYAHNEYVQMLAELGLIGFLFFVLFSLSLVMIFWRALRHPGKAVLALGGGGGMLAFAISSGASASSFRYFGGGLIFFFAAAIITHVATSTSRSDVQEPRGVFSENRYFRLAAAGCALALMLLMVYSTGAQAAGAILHGLARTSATPARAEQLYLTSLRWDQQTPSTHYSYGLWLYFNNRADEAVPHLRFATTHGYNSSTCYAYLAGSEVDAGDLAAAERTYAYAVEVYPRSVFLRARHAAALTKVGKTQEAEAELTAALAINGRAARGWQQLINFGADAATHTARTDRSIAFPGELYPEECVQLTISEIERRSGIVPAAKHFSAFPRGR